MKKIRVEYKQNLWDIAIQEYGGITGVFLLIADNPGKLAGLDSVISVGDLLKIRSAPVDKDVLKYFTDNKLKPVTGYINTTPISGDFSDDYSVDFYT